MTTGRDSDRWHRARLGGLLLRGGGGAGAHGGCRFDSSIKRGRPSTFAPNRVIKGWVCGLRRVVEGRALSLVRRRWTEALQLMVPGDKWELYIPSELAYGDRNRGQFITAGSVLVFSLELLSVDAPRHDL